MRKVNLKDVDGPWDFAVLLLEWLRKYWYIVIIILFTGGIVLSGITIQCGDKYIHKNPIPIKQHSVSDEEYDGVE